MAFKEKDISPPSLSSCPSSERPEVHQECQSSLLQEPMDFIPVMKSATSKELMFDWDHTSCTRKPCARPSLPPYLLYKVSKFRYDVSFPFLCHLPSSLHPVRDGGKKHQHRAETVGSREPWEEHFGWFFFCPPVPVFTQLLLSSFPLPRLPDVLCYSV